MQTYSFILLSFVGITILFLLSAVLYTRRTRALFQKIVITQKNTGIPSSVPLTITSKDLNAITGGDKIGTQLDLARAYIESGRTQIARKMLNHALQEGNSAQKKEAEHLLLLLL